MEIFRSHAAEVRGEEQKGAGVLASLGQTVLDTKASRLARAFFEKHGYHALALEAVMRGGVEIPRFHMRKVLPDAAFTNPIRTHP